MNDERIFPGVWIKTCWGPAVCVRVTEAHVFYRYSAIRCSDQKTIWVFNGDPFSQVKFLRTANRFTRRIVAMKGPYGLD